MANEVERRFLATKEGQGIEVRMDGEESQPTLVHHSPPWDFRSVVLWHQRGKPVHEQWERGAFAHLLNTDVRGLVNHRSDAVLGRVGNGFLVLQEDEIGLRYELKPNMETSVGRDIVALAKRKDITGSSFAFHVGEERWEEQEDLMLRTIVKARRLIDVGPVTFPAFQFTDPVALRDSGHCSAGEASLEAWIECRAKSTVVVPDPETFRRRARILELAQ